jgi:hypothetical protein
MDKKPATTVDALTALLMVYRQLENLCNKVFLLGSIDSLLFDKKTPYKIGVVHGDPLLAVPIDLHPGLSRVDCPDESVWGARFKILNAQGTVLVLVIECASRTALGLQQYQYKQNASLTQWMQLLPTQVVSLEGAGFDIPAEWHACHEGEESVAAQ